MVQVGLALALCCLTAGPTHACTIFVLTDTNRALFCNNEDWSNPNTRVWFVPAQPKHFGHVYVGFDNGWAQGGLNTEGLAFDWVAGFKETWNPDHGLTNVWGNPAEQMLESCATVAEAIAFFRGHREPSFTYAKILVADRTGASAIIGAKGGKLEAETSKQCRGFGYGGRALDLLLEESPEPTVADGARILRACLQKGKYATKYFNIFDLKSGDIYLYPAPTQDDEVKFNLTAELKKGAHYYDMPQIHEQLTRAPRPLLHNMERFLLAKYKPIPDKEPKVTAHVRAMLQDALDGTLHEDDYSAELFQEASAQRKLTQETLKTLGPFVSLTLVDRSEEGGKRSYRYRMEFERNTILQHLVFNERNKLMASETEDVK